MCINHGLGLTMTYFSAKSTTLWTPLTFDEPEVKIELYKHTDMSATSSDRDGQKLNQTHTITKTCPCNIEIFFTAVKKENFQWKMFDNFLIFAQNRNCGYTLEPLRRCGSNEFPQSMFWSKDKKNTCRYTLLKGTSRQRSGKDVI